MEGVKMDAQVELQEHVIRWLDPANAMRLIQATPVMVNTLNLYKLFVLGTRPKIGLSKDQKWRSSKFMSNGSIMIGEKFWG